MRVEMLDTNFPHAIDVVDVSSGQVTLVMPMNRTFMRFKPGAAGAAGMPPGFSGAPGALPPGIGPQRQPGGPGGPPQPPRPPAGIGPTNLPGFPAMPVMPAPPDPVPPSVGPQFQGAAAPGAPPLPMGPPGGGLELQATGELTNLLSYSCARYEIKQRGETMEIWATDQLGPFQAYLPAQPPAFGPPMIELQWSGLLSARKLFPLRAVLRADNGMERYRFEVQSVTARVLTEKERQGFQPPEGYVEIQPRPF